MCLQKIETGYKRKKEEEEEDHFSTKTRTSGINNVTPKGSNHSMSRDHE